MVQAGDVEAVKGEIDYAPVECDRMNLTRGSTLDEAR